VPHDWTASDQLIGTGVTHVERDKAAAVLAKLAHGTAPARSRRSPARVGVTAALEDHALRACFAALGIQDEARRLAVEVERRDGLDPQVRVGLNSGSGHRR
jgi:class 3 adenylate cyclase